MLYLPTYSPWLNPIEMLWRHFRHEVTHCELFANVKALIAAAYDFFNLRVPATRTSRSRLPACRRRWAAVCRTRLADP